MKTIQCFFLSVAMLIIVSCKKDKGDLSTVETYAPKYIASTAAPIGCYIKSDGGTGIAACGVYLSNSQNSETTGTQLQMGNDTGIYIGKVSGLLPGTIYYMKAYAINTKGEAITLGPMLRGG